MTGPLTRWAGLWMFAALPAGAAAACGDGLPWQAEAKGWRVAFAAQPSPIPVGRPIELRGQVCAPNDAPPARALAVDADMPAHRHGMNYRPSTQLEPDGRFTARGLLLHMPGRWRFLFDLQTATGPLRLQVELEVQ